MPIAPLLATSGIAGVTMLDDFKMFQEAELVHEGFKIVHARKILKALR